MKTFLDNRSLKRLRARAHRLRGRVLLEVLRNVRRRLINAIRCRLRRRALRKELMTLDERMLKDIAVTRGDIESIVQGTFWRSRSGMGLEDDCGHPLNEGTCCHG
jgi:uncharacterized protein YjiS (DUF1127 family)